MGGVLSFKWLGFKFQVVWFQVESLFFGGLGLLNAVGRRADDGDLKLNH